MNSKFSKLQDRDWLEGQYIGARRSINDIAGEVGCTGMTVHRALVGHDIARRRPSSRPPIFPELQDAEWLRRQYHDLGLSTGEIADQIGATDSAVRAAMMRLSIPRRSTTEARARRAREYRARIDWDDVERRYGDGEGFAAIGRDWNVTGQFIRKVLLERGVRVRTKAEQTRIEMTRLNRLEKMQAKARQRCRPTGVRGLKEALEAGSRCVFCGVGGFLHQHHLNAVRSDDRKENLVPLCPDCHRKVEWFIGHATRGLLDAYGVRPDATPNCGVEAGPDFERQ